MIGKFLRNRNNSSSADVDIYNDMLSSVSWELGRRIDEQEKKLANINVRTELLETILDNNSVIKDVSSHKNILSHLSQKSQTDNKNRTNVDIIKLIDEEKGMIASDVKIRIGKSREHTSRLLKDLCDLGFLKRDLNSRPYKYLVTDVGKEEINLMLNKST